MFHSTPVPLAFETPSIVPWTLVPLGRLAMYATMVGLFSVMAALPILPVVWAVARAAEAAAAMAEDFMMSRSFLQSSGVVACCW